MSIAASEQPTEIIPVVPVSPAVPATIPAPAAPAAPEPPAERALGRLYVLDLLRFLAAFAVLGLHYIPNHPEIWDDNLGQFGVAPSVFRYGWLGVEAFFVISGFVICMSGWGRTVPQFFTSRVTRLMPAYMVAVLITATVLTLIPEGRERPHLTHTLMNLTMLEHFMNVPFTDGVYWTLFVELKFYLLFLIVVRFGATYKRVVLFCTLWTVAALFGMYREEPLVTAIFEPRAASLFIAGTTLYLMYRFGPNLLLWCMLGVNIAIELSNLTVRAEIKTGFARYPVAVALMFAFFALMIAISLGWFNWVRWRGLVTIGALTYPLYLLHHQIGLIAIQKLHGKLPPVVLFATVAAGALLLAYAVHRLVERPVSKYLKKGLMNSFDRIRAVDARARATETGTAA